MVWRPSDEGRARGGGRGRGGDKKDGKGGADAPRRGFFRRRRVCKFCAEKIDYINYKDVTPAGAVPAGARQDSAAADFRDLRAAPAQAAGGDQARAPARADPVRTD